MPELSDFPVEILQMIAERCDFRQRFNLRSTSKLMKKVVDQSEFFLRRVKLDFRDSRTLRITFQYRRRDGYCTDHIIQKGIENAESMEKTAKWIGNILKNAEIQRLKFTNRLPTKAVEDFLQKVKDTAKSPLKAQYILCKNNNDLFSICDKSHLQGLRCFINDFNFFRKHSDTLMNLKQVELTETMDITDQDVLSMKATDIRLKSEKFSAEMVNQLVDTFIAKDFKCFIYFHIENPIGNFVPNIKIPDGFIASTRRRGEYQKVDGNKTFEMTVYNESVKLHVTTR